MMLRTPGKGFKLRWFFKEALRGFLPDEILVKKKQGFGLPFGVWLTRHEALRALATESVYGLVERGILRRGFVDTLVNEREDLIEAIRKFYYADVSAILVMILVTVAIIDSLTSLLRHRLIGLEGKN